MEWLVRIGDNGWRTRVVMDRNDVVTIYEDCDYGCPIVKIAVGIPGWNYLLIAVSQIELASAAERVDDCDPVIYRNGL